MNKDMRVAVSKRMLREGMLRCLETKPMAKITVSDLCRESGVNRATFYNHYDTPAMILKEIASEYAELFSTLYNRHRGCSDQEDTQVLEEYLTFIYEKKRDLKVLFSGNAEPYMAGVAIEIINETIVKNVHLQNDVREKEEYLLRAVTYAAAAYGLIQTWLTMDIDKTPKELARILKTVIKGDMLLRQE